MLLGEVSKKFDETDKLKSKKGNRKKPLKNTEDICFQVCIHIYL